MLDSVSKLTLYQGYAIFNGKVIVIRNFQKNLQIFLRDLFMYIYMCAGQLKVTEHDYLLVWINSVQFNCALWK